VAVSPSTWRSVTFWISMPAVNSTAATRQRTTPIQSPPPDESIAITATPLMATIEPTTSARG
jgi:hypothetical protein